MPDPLLEVSAWLALIWEEAMDDIWEALMLERACERVLPLDDHNRIVRGFAHA